MKVWPEFDDNGDLPVGVHPAMLDEVIEHFGSPTLRRRLVGQRLERIYKLVISTGAVARFVVYGSFITSKPDPHDVDVFMLMEDSFDSHQVAGEAALVFDHLAAQNMYGASVFWIRRMAAIGGEQTAIEYWQIKRDKSFRGIVEVISNDSKQS